MHFLEENSGASAGNRAAKPIRHGHTARSQASQSRNKAPWGLVAGRRAVPQPPRERAAPVRSATRRIHCDESGRHRL